jgi:hypothetical protein
MSLNTVEVFPWLRILCSVFWFDGTCSHYKGHIVTAAGQGRTVVWEQDPILCRCPLAAVLCRYKWLLSSHISRPNYTLRCILWDGEPSVSVEWFIFAGSPVRISAMRQKPGQRLMSFHLHIRVLDTLHVHYSEDVLNSRIIQCDNAGNVILNFWCDYSLCEVTTTTA